MGLTVVLILLALIDHVQAAECRRDALSPGMDFNHDF